MRYVSVALSAVLLSALTIQSAVADEFSDEIFSPRAGLYLAGSFGTTFDYEFNGNDLANSVLENVYDLGESDVYTGAIGTYLGGFRAEFEISYFESEFENFFPTGTDLTGDVRYLTFMGNLYYDLPTGIGALDLYIGGGVGFAILNSRGTFNPALNFVDSDGNPAGTVDDADSTFNVFSAQAMAGLSYEVVENVHIFGGYRARWFSEDSTETDDGLNLIFREHTVQSVEAGIRIDF